MWGELGHGPTLPPLSVPTLPIPTIFDFNLNLGTGIDHIDFANALMGEDCHSYLAEYPRTVYYIVLKIHEIAYIRVQFLLFGA